ncbi:protein farnesyltransferase subunit beta [Tanacetum coccineum]
MDKIVYRVFQCSLWAIWKWRNKLVNAKLEDVASIKEEDIFPSIQRLTKTWIAARFSKEVQPDNHIKYLMKGLRNLGPLFVVLDANWPWLFYWILHSIAILGECVDVALDHNPIDFLSRCKDEYGGHG